MTPGASPKVIGAIAPPTDLGELLTPGKVAEMLPLSDTGKPVSRAWVLRNVPCRVMLGKKVFYRRGSVERWIISREQKAAS